MKLPRILFGAASSGSGKTLLTCGILQALRERGLRVSSFKCGPDYIDPMFHTQVLGAHSRNLDTFFTGENLTRYLLAENSREADIAVMEGVMGYYDGIGGTTSGASSYDLARVTQTPVVLIVNGRGMSLSLAALVKGFVDFRPNSGIRGVIFNQVSPNIYEELKSIVEKECGVKVLGYVPNLKDYVIESRHLGLVTPEEVEGLQEKLAGLAKILERSLDFDELIAMAKQAPELEEEEPTLPRLEESVRIGVARDAAFCFYYEDNLELLRKMGAELVEFSPLRDSALPESLDGLIFGGGYPELFARRLEENETLRRQIREALEAGIPCVAECGGFLYLQKELEDMKTFSHEMVGFLPGKGYHTGRLSRFGYVELTARCETVFGPAGTALKGHEFHYFDSTDCGNAFLAKKPVRENTWDCVHGSENLAAGFPHFYYYSNPEAAFHFLERGVAYAHRRDHS
ncbi:cobyrinate a,c-diamide synthase [Hominifimenecus sp. rT4P-3]|uniref:cobyrinate a,c-diamide synthase n=1 Tax=Hominifimenecus sp. rT4P-3 TaxID=3242979 RepID=UPI003DA23D3F